MEGNRIEDRAAGVLRAAPAMSSPQAAEGIGRCRWNSPADRSLETNRRDASSLQPAHCHRSY
jgi:hypothetical protein